MEANYDCQKSNKSPLMYCQLQDSNFQQVELPGLAQNDLLWPGLLNQDACSTSKVSCWTLGHIIEGPHWGGLLSWSHVQALPAKAQWINDSCT